MKEFDVETGDVSVGSSPNNRTPPLRVLPPPELVAIARPRHAKPDRVRNPKGRKRLITFIALEFSAALLLVALLLVGTSQAFAQPELTTSFIIGIVAAASLLVAIPVIFFGLPRQRYPYRRRRPGG